MDLDELRSFLRQSRVSVFDIIDTAINLASSDHPSDFKHHRPGIVDKLYYSVRPACRNCDASAAAVVVGNEGLMATPRREEEEEEEGEAVGDSFGGLFDDDDVVVDDAVVDDVEEEEDEETRVLRIKDSLEHPNQTEDSLVELLQTLADMDITFKALKETDIGRHVNRLRKHPSNDVRILVKQLVRKWKDLVDEWVKVNTPDEHTASTLIGDGDSPQPPRRNTHNGHHQVSEFAYSPNPHNGNNSESELKPKVVPRRDSAIKPPHSANASASAPPKFQRQQRDSIVDQDRLDSARKRLQENYQDAQNAKKQRKIQVMDIHEIPKPKNGYIARNKGGPHGRHR